VSTGGLALRLDQPISRSLMAVRQGKVPLLDMSVRTLKVSLDGSESAVDSAVVVIYHDGETAQG
jgi:hypothetical protein